MVHVLSPRQVLIATSLALSTLATVATSPVQYELVSSSPPPLSVVLTSAQPDARVRAHVTLRSADDVTGFGSHAVLRLSPRAVGSHAGLIPQAVGVVAVSMDAAGPGTDAGLPSSDGGVQTRLLLDAQYPLSDVMDSSPAPVLEQCPSARLCEQDLFFNFHAHDLGATPSLEVFWDVAITARYLSKVDGDTLTVDYFVE